MKLLTFLVLLMPVTVYGATNVERDACIAACGTVAAYEQVRDDNDARHCVNCAEVCAEHPEACPSTLRTKIDRCIARQCDAHSVPGAPHDE